MKRLVRILPLNAGAHVSITANWPWKMQPRPFWPSWVRWGALTIPRFFFGRHWTMAAFQNLSVKWWSGWLSAQSFWGPTFMPRATRKYHQKLLRTQTNAEERIITDLVRVRPRPSASLRNPCPSRQKLAADIRQQPKGQPILDSIEDTEERMN